MATTMAHTQSAAASTDTAHEKVAAAFGLSAAITVLFNVILAFIKDSWPALNSFMAMLTGHHWRTHGLTSTLHCRRQFLHALALAFAECQRRLSAGSAASPRRKTQ